MKVNDRMLALIRRFEGLRLRAYRDAAGVWTIGYGHTSMAGPPKVRPGMRITRVEAEEILRRDVEKFARGVAREIGHEALKRLNENQFGALVSFAYNVGLGNFRRSSILRAVRAGRLDDVPRLLLRWTKARDPKTGQLVQLRGLVRRRRAEGQLFTTRVKPAKPAKQPVGVSDPARVEKEPVGVSDPDRNVHAEPPPAPAPVTSRKAAPVAAFFIGLAATMAAIFWRNRLMRFIHRLFAPLKGWRTLLFALLVAAIGVAEATDWAQIVPDGPQKGLWLLAISLAIAFLRVITTTPPGKRES